MGVKTPRLSWPPSAICNLLLRRCCATLTVLGFREMCACFSVQPLNFRSVRGKGFGTPSTCMAPQAP